jgi:tripartite-type tricarboxylate transporter receptor subunit TctC
MRGAVRIVRHSAAWLTGFLFACVVCAGAFAQADKFPNKPIRFVIGPSPDVVARVVGQYLHQAWGQPVVIEPRTGAGGQIAANTVATADPDGYTYLFATPSYTLNTAMKTASYDIIKDFAPAALFGTGSYTLVVRKDLPVNSVAELIAYAKAHPGKLNCASAGIGTAPHLACEMFNKIPGVSVVHVPYRGVNDAMNGVVAGNVDMFVSVTLVAKQQILSKSVRGIASTGSHRSQLLPDLPTLAESGYPKFVLEGWNGILATAGTPRPILEKINAEVARGIAQPDVHKRLVDLGTEFPSHPLSVDEFSNFVKADIAHWTELVNYAGRDKLVPGGH